MQAQPVYANPAPQAQAPRAPQATQWTKAPAQQGASAALAKPPAVVRGVAPEAPKFVLAEPESLGISTSLSSPAPATQAASPVQVDWNQIQARMERLRVVGYDKLPVSGGVKVTLFLETGNPGQRQPVQAEAATEAAAVTLALQYGEAWAQQRRP